MADERARQLRKAMTPAEVRLWLALRQLRPQRLHFRRQVPRAGYILDFACLPAKLVIEVDGEQHGLDPHKGHDRRRDATLEALGFRTLRFWNHEVLTDCDDVVETIMHHTRERLAASSS